MENIRMVLMRVDWILLQHQKRWLYELPECNDSLGLLHLIDAIQDAVVCDGLKPEDKVFPGFDARIPPNEPLRDIKV